MAGTFTITGNAQGLLSGGKTIGPLTVSRIIEGLLLVMIAGCGAWFIRDARAGQTA